MNGRMLSWQWTASDGNVQWAAFGQSRRSFAANSWVRRSKMLFLVASTALRRCGMGGFRAFETTGIPMAEKAIPMGTHGWYQTFHDPFPSVQAYWQLTADDRLAGVVTCSTFCAICAINIESN
jgi:hypothetical protein